MAPDDLLDGPCPAVLTTTRRDGTPLTSPVWVRHERDAFEIVMVESDGKVGNLRRDPRCLLVVFEAVPPFRGIEVRGNAIVEPSDLIDAVRLDIATRYLGHERGERFAAARSDRPSVLVRIPSDGARRWDLASIV